MSQVFYNADNLTISNGFIRNPDRYYLEEYFSKLPTLEAPVSVTQATNITTGITSNSKHTLITTNSTNSNVTASEWVEFTFTNSFITANSIVNVMCQDSADDTAGNEKLLFQVNDVQAGSCEIRCINPSASAATSQVYKLSVIVDPHLTSNSDFCIADSTGASATTSVVDTSVAYSTTRAGINLATTGTDNDTVVLLPRTTTSQELGNDSAPSAWTGIKWGTENCVEWMCALSVADVANVALWAGLKLTKTPVLATDADQIYFFFDSDDSVVGTLTTNTTLHVCYSVGGTDYITNLGITLEADIIYKLRIVIDKYRQASVFVNGRQYGLTGTSGSTGGSTESTATKKSERLTNDIDLIPYIGVQSTTAAADTLTVYYQKMSRDLFE